MSDDQNVISKPDVEKIFYTCHDRLRNDFNSLYGKKTGYTFGVKYITAYINNWQYSLGTGDSTAIVEYYVFNDKHELLVDNVYRFDFNIRFNKGTCKYLYTLTLCNVDYNDVGYYEEKY